MDSMSRSTLVPPCYDDETPEESSWTMYFKEFSNGNDDGVEMNGNDSCCSCDINHQAPSLVSLEHNKSSKKKRLSFKKRKTNGSFVDDDLEDTASSPVNSPKMCDMENQFGKNMKMKDVMDISKEDKGSGSTREEMSWVSSMVEEMKKLN
ncbi:Electron transfer flavoprotein alpha isoform 1 [Hibiscus syriacus]|uniref:Electron transfer flavoprotein alpha isoform 1 n=1 Tax=Hibiscus syriacus TaxID=106335 RepID=A0A6A2YLL7_HIBSY|nr:vascular-related unknown protein 4-like [Hibiscus syriacus]KAE8680204.1 Electron transfer flavoprotein alpha isoform 1 [Hibiscus syriacus]